MKTNAQRQSASRIPPAAVLSSRWEATAFALASSALPASASRRACNAGLVTMLHTKNEQDTRQLPYEPKRMRASGGPGQSLRASGRPAQHRKPRDITNRDRGCGQNRTGSETPSTRLRIWWARRSRCVPSAASCLGGNRRCSTISAASARSSRGFFRSALIATELLKRLYEPWINEVS